MRFTQATMAIGCTLGVLVGPTAASAAERRHFKADLQTTSQFVPIQFVNSLRCVDEVGHAPAIGMLKVVGSGDASILGPVLDEQSHCLRADFSFFDGRFTMTNAEGDAISGRYFGELLPTFNSTFPPDAPPGGPWLILGNVCIENGMAGRIDNDCRRGSYRPARGITNVTTGDATIFLDQTIGIGGR